MSQPQWKGLFEWSMKYHDGTRPADFSAAEVDPEKLKWLEEALQHYVMNFADRMKDIKEVFDSGENRNTSLDEKIALLDELQDIVESVDHAKNLHSIGGLPTLLEILECPFPVLRQKAAEIVSTCVQNNLPVQQWFLKDGVLPPLMRLLEDDNELCRAKGWLATSSLVRNFPDAEEAFLRQGGATKVLTAASDTNNSIRRRALFIVQYLLQANSRAQMLQLNSVSVVTKSLVSSSCEIREAALMALVEVARDSEGRAMLLQDTGLLERVSSIYKKLSDLSEEDKEDCLTELSYSTEILQLLNLHSV